MATTITGKLSKHAQIFPAGESTGFGIRVGVKYYDRETKTELWTNYQAVVFAKAPAQIQFYQQALVEGAIVEISGDKQRIKQWQGQNGLQLSIEILDAKLGFISGGNPAPAPQQARPAQAAANSKTVTYPQQNASPQPAQQAMPMHGAYANNTFGQRGPAPGAPIDFDDDIPFAPIGKQCRKLLHVI
jgi:single-strand DNA-binding protein